MTKRDRICIAGVLAILAIAIVNSFVAVLTWREADIWTRGYCAGFQEARKILEGRR